MDNIPKQPIYINISAMTIVKIILVLTLFYFLYMVRDILAILFVAIVLYSAVNPFVDWMHRHRIPRGLGILLIYLLLFIAFGGILYLLIPPIAAEIGKLTADFPLIYEKIISGLGGLREFSIEYGFLENIKGGLQSLGANLERAAGGVFSTVAGIFGGAVTFFITLVITFYMVVEEDAMKKIIWSTVPKQHQVYVVRLINRMQQKIGLWLRGQLILSLIIFTLTYSALKTVDLMTGQIEYALVLALLAGLTEFVPYLGPILAAIPAVFLAFAQSPLLGVIVAVMYYAIQLIENNIIVPKLMQKVVGLNPIISIAVLLIGFKIGGVAGAVLAIPVATAAAVFIRDVFERNTQEEPAVRTE